MSKPAALAQPEQAPVDEIEKAVPDSEHATIAEWWADKQRKPLTDGQIHDCFQQKHKDKVTERRMIARAIERAHGIMP